MLLKRVGWGMVDQALVSCTSLVLGVMGVATLSAPDFGRLATSLAVFYLLQACVRAVVAEVYVVRFAGVPLSECAPSARAAQRAVLRLAATVSILLLAVSVVPGLASFRAVIVALAAAAPALLWQDTRRSILTAAGRTALSARSSGVLLCGLAVGGLTLRVLDAVSPAALLGTWAAAALISIATVRISARGGVSEGLRGWLVGNRPLWSRFLVEAMASSGAGQVGILLVATTAGVVVVGGIRAATVLLAPMTVLQQAAAQLTLAEAARVDRRSLGRFVLSSQLVIAVLGVTWIVIVEVLPQRWLSLLLGASLAQAKAALPGMAVYLIAGSLTVAPSAALRLSGHIQLGMLLRLVPLPIVVVGPPVVAAYGGTAAEVGWMFGAAGALATICWTAASRRVLPRDARAGARHRGSSPPPARDLSGSSPSGPRHRATAGSWHPAGRGSRRRAEPFRRGRSHSAKHAVARGRCPGRSRS